MSNKTNDYKRAIKKISTSIVQNKEPIINNLIDNRFPSVHSNQLINEIHEYCIKKILQDQAEGFYKCFFLIDLVPLLIPPFLRMEQFKREDRYEEFCLALFQQLEILTNYIFKNTSIQNYIEKNSNKLVCNKYNYTTQKNNLSGTEKVSTIIFFEENIKWTAISKFKAILFVNYFNEDIGNNTFEFYRKSTILSEINNVRSLVHGGESLYGNQKLIAEKSVLNKYTNYIKLSGFLEDFLSTIKINKNNRLKDVTE